MTLPPRGRRPRTHPGVGLRRALLALVVVLGVAAPLAAAPASAVAPPPAAARLAQGGADVSVEGETVTVQVAGTPGHQVRVELQDDSIAGTGLLTETGSTTITLQLDPGSYTLEVITFDPAGIPTSVGEFPVTVAPPPPGPPSVEVRSGTVEDNRSVLAVTGQPGLGYRIQIVREGETVEDESGDLDGEGRAEVAFLLPTGPWGYVVTQSNQSGAGSPALAEFEVSYGAPPPPQIALTTPPGKNPAELAVTGPRGGTVRLTAEGDDRTLEDEIDLDADGAGTSELRFTADGDWSLVAVAVDVAGQESEPARLEVTVDSEGPPIDAVPLSAGSDEFGFRIITEPGVVVTVTSETEALNLEFTAEDEETDFRIAVPPGEHVIEVRGRDSSGNESFDLLSSDEDPPAGFPWATLGLILLVIGGLFGGYAFVRRQDIIDWYHTRQYR